MGIADHIQSFYIPVVSCLEVVCAGIRINHRDVIFCACYRPPDASSTFCNDLHDVLNNIVVRYPHLPIFLLGDLDFLKIL